MVVVLLIKCLWKTHCSYVCSYCDVARHRAVVSINSVTSNTYLQTQWLLCEMLLSRNNS